MNQYQPICKMARSTPWIMQCVKKLMAHKEQETLEVWKVSSHIVQEALSKKIYGFVSYTKLDVVYRDLDELLFKMIRNNQDANK